jgi:hypothetical protein
MEGVDMNLYQQAVLHTKAYVAQHTAPTYTSEEQALNDDEYDE